MIDTAQRVLIVDDETSIRRYLRAVLGAEGCHFCIIAELQINVLLLNLVLDGIQ